MGAENRLTYKDRFSRRKNNIPNNFRDSIVLPVRQVVVLPLEVKLSPILLLRLPSAFSIVLLSIAIRDAENFVFFLA